MDWFNFEMILIDQQRLRVDEVVYSFLITIKEMKITI